MLPKRVHGKTAHYKGNGRKFGYPTANIDSPTTLQEGVYFGYANLGEYKNWPALIFVGVPVTVGDTESRIEAHLLDIPDVDYYDLELQLTIHHKHRDNHNFTSLEKLMMAMGQDEAHARKWFKLHKDLQQD